MHKSKLAGFIIDCQTSDLEGAAAFWSAALGLQTRRMADPAEQDYIELLNHQQPLHIEVQRVSHPSRVHLDIETDDLDAEVARLERLGARRVGFVRRWWVMEAPTGQRFCVVQRCNADFEQKATTWADD
jgi:predicted enzyme related to lactoylglutathione lyase